MADASNEGRTVTLVEGQSPIKENWKYCIVQGPEGYALSKAVNEMMAKGWSPLGGAFSGAGGFLYQTLVHQTRVQ